MPDGLDIVEFESKMELLLYPFLRELIEEIEILFPDFIVELPKLSHTLAGKLIVILNAYFRWDTFP